MEQARELLDLLQHSQLKVNTHDLLIFIISFTITDSPFTVQNSVEMGKASRTN